jgi:hypothetical protein
MIIVPSNENVTEETMASEEHMTINERRKYLHRMRFRYWQCQSRKERSKLLDEMEMITELHRKTLIRLINGELERKPRQKQRGKTYGMEVRSAVEVIARSLDYPCAERLQPNLVWMAKHLIRHDELHTTPEVLQKLGQLSVSSLWRLLPRAGPQRPRLAQHKKRPGAPNQLRAVVPVRRINWDEPEPGHFEADLVHHCGSSPDGQYVYSLQLVDVTTGWSECAALLGRSFLVMEDGFQRVFHRLPFPVLELHPDNGSEFFNDFLLKSLKEKVKGLKLSRSRPFQKNDNRFVEENNFSLVRAYVGYQRLDTVEQTRLLNQLYDLLWVYHNFFQPVMRLKEKIPTSDPLHSKRRYGQAQTPFDRLCAHGVLDDERLHQLHSLREATNPLQLRCAIEQLTIQLFNLPGARDGVTENVHDTLGLWRVEPLPKTMEFAYRDG